MESLKRRTDVLNANYTFLNEDRVKTIRPNILKIHGDVPESIHKKRSETKVECRGVRIFDAMSILQRANYAGSVLGMRLLTWHQLRPDLIRVALHLAPFVRREVAPPSRNISLHGCHYVDIDFIDEIVALVFDCIQRISVSRNLIVRPFKKRRGVKPDDLGSAVRGIEKTTFDRDRLLHEGTVPQFGCMGFTQSRAVLRLAQALGFEPEKVNIWGCLSS